MPEDLREKIKKDIGLDGNVQLFMLPGGTAVETEYRKMYKFTALVGIIDIALGVGTKEELGSFMSKVGESYNIDKESIPGIMMTALRYIIDNQKFLLDENLIVRTLSKDDLNEIFVAYLGSNSDLNTVIQLYGKSCELEKKINNPDYGYRPSSPDSVTVSDRPGFIGVKKYALSFEDYAVYQTMYDMLNTKTENLKPQFKSFYLARAVDGKRITKLHAYNIFRRARKELMMTLSGGLRTFLDNFDSSASYSSDENMSLYNRRMYLDYVKENFSVQFDQEAFSTSDKKSPHFSLMSLTKIADFMTANDVPKFIQNNEGFELHKFALEANNNARCLRYMYKDKNIPPDLQKTKMGLAWASYALATKNGASAFVVAPPDCEHIGGGGKSAEGLLKDEGRVLQKVVEYLQDSSIDGDVKSNLLPLVDYNTCWVLLSNFNSGMKRSPLEKLNDLIDECNSDKYGIQQINQSVKDELMSFHDQMVSARVRNFMLSKPREFLEEILGKNNDASSTNVPTSGI